MLHRAAFVQRHSRALAQRTFFGFGKADAPPPVSLEGKVCWVVGGVDVVGQHVVRGLLDAGASVIVNTRSTTRLEALVEGLGRPERLTPIKGSLLPGRAEATVDRVMEMSGNRLDHVVAHAGVRYWAGRGACDETRTLAGLRVAARHGGGKLGLGRAAPGPAAPRCVSIFLYLWWGC